MSIGYYIGQDDKTSCGGMVLDGHEGVTFDGMLQAREGDQVSCGKDGKTYRIIGGYWGFTSDGTPVAGTLDSVSGCPCRAQLIPSVTWATYTYGTSATPRSSWGTSHWVDSNSTYHSPSSSSSRFAAPATITVSSQDCVFAKSCVSVPAGSSDAGTASEPAANFGATALLASTGTAGTLGRVAGTVGSKLGSWTIGEVAAQVGSRLSVVLLALWPRDIGDSTLYSPEQLASMRSASTRVRFQFRPDAQGTLQVYGLHTRPGNGTDRVPVTQARWNASKSAMVAVLDGITITWTPNHGPVVNLPTPYPGTPERLDNLLVHPIAPGRETQINHYPGQDADDLTWLDTIITFPADSGAPPLYLVFAKPAVRPLKVSDQKLALSCGSGPKPKPSKKSSFP